MPVPDALVDSVVRFLGAHAPFAQMAAADLRFLIEHLALAYFPAQAVIVETSAADAAPLHIVQRGHVRFEPSAGEGVVLGPGECFPLQAAGTLAGAPGRFVATEDVFCYLLEGPPMRTLQGRSPAFRGQALPSPGRASRRSRATVGRSRRSRPRQGPGRSWSDRRRCGRW